MKRNSQSLLYNQLVKPEISFENFRKIPDVEIINLTRKFIKEEYNLSEYFNETNDSEFAKNLEGIK